MIKHIVLLQFKSDISEAEINSVFTQLGYLQSAIPSVQDYTFGINCSPEQLNKGFSHAFIMEFDDVKGRNAYLEHPEHHRVVQNVIIPLLQNGLESAITFDYEHFINI